MLNISKISNKHIVGNQIGKLQFVYIVHTIASGEYFQFVVCGGVKIYKSFDCLCVYDQLPELLILGCDPDRTSAGMAHPGLNTANGNERCCGQCNGIGAHEKQSFYP
jgi:hypothetical protein